MTARRLAAAFGPVVASGTYVAADAVGRATALGLAFFYARYLTAADVGVYGLVSTLTLLLLPILGLSISSGFIRLWFEMGDERGRARLIRSTLVSVVLSGVLVGVVVEGVGELGGLRLFRGIPYSPYLRYALLIAFFSLFIDLVASLWIVERRPNRVLALSTAQAVLTVGLSVALVIGLRQGLIGALRAVAIATAAGAAASIGVILRRGGHGGRPSRAVIRQCLAFSVPLVPAALAQWVLQVSDRPVLAHFLTAASVGKYYIGYSVGASAGLAVHGVGRMLQPRVTEDLKRGRVADVARVGTYAFAALALVSLVIALIGRDIVALVVPARLDGAQRVVPVVAFAHVAFAGYVILSQGIWYGMRTRLVPLLTLTAGAINVGLNIVLVPRYGILAAAWDTAVGFSVLALLHGIVAARVHRIPWELRRWVKAVAAAAASYGVASAAGMKPSGLRAVLEAVAILVIFPGALLALRFWTPSEWRSLRSVARIPPL